MKLQVLGAEENKLGNLLPMNFFNFFIKKFKVYVYLGTLLSRCLRFQLSSFKFLLAFGILATRQGLTGIVKI